MREAVGVVVACVVGVSASACATKGFVRDSVAEVNKKVESVSQSLEATQEQTRENTARIQQVDKKATQAGSVAQAAQASAKSAANQTGGAERHPRWTSTEGCD